MRIEVVCIAAAGAIVREYRIEAPATVGDALRLAAPDPAFAGAGLATAAVGVFGRVVSRQEPLADGDRIEIYRGPAVDPRQARRARARSR
jgi:putative ubiquitin-RnfH superfamily antitoxin RatB of RatAB toxin-antitoxin module